MQAEKINLCIHYLETLYKRKQRILARHPITTFSIIWKSSSQFHQYKIIERRTWFVWQPKRRAGKYVKSVITSVENGARSFGSPMFTITISWIGCKIIVVSFFFYFLFSLIPFVLRLYAEYVIELMVSNRFWNSCRTFNKCDKSTMDVIWHFILIFV